MKPSKFLTITIIAMFSDVSCAENKSSQTFLFPHLIFQNMAARDSLWDNIIYEKTTRHEACLQAIGMFQKSVHSQNVAGYFLIDCKSTISVKGQQGAFIPGEWDVRAQWLNLPSNFSGTLTLNPQQRQIAVILNYNQTLSHFFCHKIFKYLWYDLSMPIAQVENDLRPMGSPEVITAMNQPDWHFAKIPTQKRKKIGVPEIKLILGATIYNKNDFLFTIHTLGVLPTSKNNNPEYLFSPMLDIDSKVGFGAGTKFIAPLNDYTDSNSIKSLFVCGLEAQYFIKNKQRRTCDLKNKQWSRYMLYRKPNDPNVVPGVNILTIYCEVNPYSFFEFTADWRIQYKGLELEIGYDIWAQERETIEPVSPKCQQTPFSFEFYGIAGQMPGTSASESTIAFQAPDDPIFKNITIYDINFSSAARQNAFVNKLHFAAGYTYYGPAIFIAGVGIFMEKPAANTAFKNYGFWAKIGASY